MLLECEYHSEDDSYSYGDDEIDIDMEDDAPAADVDPEWCVDTTKTLS